MVAVALILFGSESEVFAAAIVNDRAHHKYLDLCSVVRFGKVTQVSSRDAVHCPEYKHGHLEDDSRTTVVIIN